MRQMRALKCGTRIAFIMLLPPSFLPCFGRKHSHAIKRADCDGTKISTTIINPDKKQASTQGAHDPQHAGKGLV